MAGHYRNDRGLSGGNRARRGLQIRHERDAMGEQAYDKSVDHADNRGFLWFGLAFIVVLGIVFFTLT